MERKFRLCPTCKNIVPNVDLCRECGEVLPELTEENRDGS